MKKTEREGSQWSPTHPALKSIVIALAMSVMAVLFLCAPTGAVGKESPTADHAVLQAFETASRHWGVPVQVLMAVGYVESHWEQRDGQPSLDHGYGIMHLVDSPGGTLEA